MKKFILAAAVFPLFSFAAYAADLPNTKGPPAFAPPPPPVFSWTGLYVGLNAGGAFGHTSIDSFELPTPAAFGNPPYSQDFSSSGFIGGGQIGYNYQTGPLVVGLETDFQGSTLRSTSTTLVPPPPVGSNQVATERLDWFGTVRGRLGYAFDQVLFYATGGLMYGQVSSSTLTTFTPAAPFTYSGSNSAVRVGFVAGGGIEYAITPNWSIKAEGLYFDLGNNSFVASPLAANPPFAIAQSARLTGVIARVGVNYKFDMFAPPGPVVAKY